MRIDNNPLTLARAIGQTPQTGQAAGKTCTAGPAGSGDQVRISDLAAQLSADPSRLAQLHAAVRSGTYNVSPSQIANSMITDALNHPSD